MTGSGATAVDHRGDERRGRHVTGVAAGLGALCGDDVDARVGCAPCLVDGAHLADHDRAGVVGVGTKGVGSANEWAITRMPSSSAAFMSRQALGRWLSSPTPSGPSVSPRAVRTCSTSQRVSPSVVPPIMPRPPALVTAAASARGALPTHRRVEDRVRDAEQVADAGLEPHGLAARTFDGVDSHAAVVGLGFEGAG